MKPSSVLDHLRRLRTTAALVSSGVTVEGRVSCGGVLPIVHNAGRIGLKDGVSFRAPRDPVRMKTTTSGLITIEERSFLNEGARLYATRMIHIGPDCLIGDYCWICDTNFHSVHEGRAPRVAAIRIGRNVWLGRSAQILPGSDIGDHCVISAGSIVSGTVLPRTIMRGVPAIPVCTVSCSDDWIRT